MSNKTVAYRYRRKGTNNPWNYIDQAEFPRLMNKDKFKREMQFQALTAKPVNGYDF